MDAVELAIKLLEAKAENSRGVVFTNSSGGKVKIEYADAIKELKRLNKKQDHKCANCEHFASAPYRAEGRCTNTYPPDRHKRDTCSRWEKRSRKPYPWEEEKKSERVGVTDEVRQKFLDSRPTIRGKG